MPVPSCRTATVATVATTTSPHRSEGIELAAPHGSTAARCWGPNPLIRTESPRECTTMSALKELASFQRVTSRCRKKVPARLTTIAMTAILVTAPRPVLAALVWPEPRLLATTESLVPTTRAMHLPASANTFPTTRIVTMGFFATAQRRAMLHFLAAASPALIPAHREKRAMLMLTSASVRLLRLVTLTIPIPCSAVRAAAVPVLRIPGKAVLVEAREEPVQLPPSTLAVMEVAVVRPKLRLATLSPTRTIAEPELIASATAKMVKGFAALIAVPAFPSNLSFALEVMHPAKMMPNVAAVIAEATATVVARKKAYQNQFI